MERRLRKDFALAGKALIRWEVQRWPGRWECCTLMFTVGQRSADEIGVMSHRQDEEKEKEGAESSKPK